MGERDTSELGYRTGVVSRPLVTLRFFLGLFADEVKLDKILHTRKI